MNDPRITAYAVGELEPAEREAFERELATSTELQHELAETVALAEQLTAKLGDTADQLDDARRAKIFAAAHSDEAHRPWARIWVPAMAAGFIALLALVSLQTRRESGTSETSLAATEPQGVDLMTAQTVLAKSGGEPAGIALAGQATPPHPLLDAVDGTPPEFDVFIKEGKAAPSDAESSETGALLAEAKNHLEEGRYDLASRRSEEVPRRDPYNTAARRELEKMSTEVSTFASNDAFNETRSRISAPFSADAKRKAEAEVPAAPQSTANRGVWANTALATGWDSPQAPGQVGGPTFNTEAYDSVTPNGFLDVAGNPLSTFSIDVDTASYANVRRFLNDGMLPPSGAVRIEELINYFPYDLPAPAEDAPFSVTTDVTRAPWNPGHLLARIALKGRDVAPGSLPPSNLVFLVDVSGSMRPENKLPLLKRALRRLVDRLSPKDSVAIVTYAGSSGVVLPPTDGNDKAKVLAALDRLESGGSTNGAGGIQLAYETAREHFLPEGNNRVILCTDGDFNVGVTSQSELVRLIEKERESGVFLSVLGFGTGNVKDSTMEKLADSGNGNYAYVDSLSEARKVLVEQMAGTLFTIAKDVKIQVEFNPATVAGYRLIGYENRLLAKEDFNDDTKDAGEIGVGHTVTALYEIVPAGRKLPTERSVDPLKYQTARTRESAPASDDLFTVKLRYKAPDGDKSRLIEKAVGNEVVEFEKAPVDCRFAAAVAAFGMKLRGDEDAEKFEFADIQRIARESLGADPGSYRAEFLTLIEKAKRLHEESGASRE